MRVTKLIWVSTILHRFERKLNCGTDDGCIFDDDYYEDHGVGAVDANVVDAVDDVWDNLTSTQVAYPLDT